MRYEIYTMDEKGNFYKENTKNAFPEPQFSASISLFIAENSLNLAEIFLSSALNRYEFKVQNLNIFFPTANLPEGLSITFSQKNDIIIALWFS